MASSVPQIEVLDALLLKKEAGFFDFLRSPSRPTFGPPTTVAGMAPRKKKDLKKTQRRESELWNHWNDNGRKKKDLEPLYISYKPVINQEVRRWTRNEIPASAIRAEVNMHFMNAVKSFDPSKAGLNTWVTKNFKKTQRFIATYQNIGKIPEGQLRLITPYKLAKDELATKFGHEPDVDSIAAHMGQPTRKIIQLQKELSRRDLAVSGFEAEGMGGDPVTNLTPRELEAFNLIKYDLTPEEKIVYEYTFGVDGKPLLRPGEIAKQAKIHPSKVSRIRKKLKDKVQEAMEYI